MARLNDDYLLGYLSYFFSQQKGYYGGLLVTDTRGVPKEFRHSEGVKPSKLQSTLYGDSLEASLGTDTLAPALYDALTVKPDILLINKAGKEMFGRFAHMYPPAALFIAYLDSDMAFADSLSSDGNLVHPASFDLKGDTKERLYAYMEDVAGSRKGSEILELAQTRMNLLSPFDRVDAVLAEIAQVK